MRCKRQSDPEVYFVKLYIKTLPHTIAATAIWLLLFVGWNYLLMIDWGRTLLVVSTAPFVFTGLLANLVLSWKMPPLVQSGSPLIWYRKPGTLLRQGEGLRLTAFVGTFVCMLLSFVNLTPSSKSWEAYYLVTVLAVFMLSYAILFSRNSLIVFQRRQVTLSGWGQISSRTNPFWFWAWMILSVVVAVFLTLPAVLMLALASELLWSPVG